jgi:capsular polysaccharide transport system permease protein
MDIIYARILLEFASAIAVFLFLFPIFVVVGICRIPNNVFIMATGYLLVIWFSFGFVLIMAGLAELSETIEKTSHIILYLMLPFSGVFIPTFLVPEPYRSYLLYFPLIDAVDYFHHGYFGPDVPSYYHIFYTVVALMGMTLFGLALSGLAIGKVRAA